METIYADAFRRFSSVEGEPDRLRKLRRDAFELFTVTGFPAVKSEDWKYTNVAPIATGEWNVNDRKGKVPADIDIELLAKFKTERNGFAALNLAFGEFATLRISKDTVIDKPIEFECEDNCTDCHGSGAQPGSTVETCSACGGRGQVVRSQGFFSMATTCPQCRGKGQTIKTPCKTCRGLGRRTVEHDQF